MVQEVAPFLLSCVFFVFVFCLPRGVVGRVHTNTPRTTRHGDSMRDPADAFPLSISKPRVEGGLQQSRFLSLSWNNNSSSAVQYSSRVHVAVSLLDTKCPWVVSFIECGL